MTLNRTSVALLVLAGLILIGFSDDGYSQQQPDTLQKPGKEQPSTAIQPTLRSPRLDGLGLQVIADLSVSPLVYTGSCPAVFTFKGRIYANKATEVLYKFIRSDGVYSEVKSLVFEKEGRQEVTYTWQVGDPAKLSKFRGSIIMQVLFPIGMIIKSNEAIFRGTCTGQGKPGPENPAGQQTVQQGLSAAPSFFPSPTGKQGEPAVAFPSTPGQQGQPPVPFPSPTGQQGQPPMAFPSPTGQQGQPAMPLPSPAGKQGQPPVPFPALTGQQGQPATPFPSPAGQQGKPATGDGDCVTFDPATTKVRQSQGNWAVVDGPRTLFSFGAEKVEAEKALAIIKHYKMDRSCFVGHPRPSFHYMLAGGSAPVGPFPGEDCRSFNPAMIYALWIKGWRVVDGNNALFAFDADKDGADQALAIIKGYGFTHSCRMARGGKVDFLYLRR